MDTLTIAQKYHKDGIAVIPVKYRDKKPLVKWKEYQSRLPTITELGYWFITPQPKNIALVTGWRGLTVIDFDNQDVYRDWQFWATRHNGIASYLATRSYRVVTSRGVHCYLRLPKATRTRPLLSNGDKAGIDIKSAGGYVLIPPSVHPSGADYVTPNKNAIIPIVQALSDVLPVDLLTNTEYTRAGGSKNLNKKHTMHNAAADPWTMADNAGAPSEDLIRTIKEAFPIESFFDQTWETGNGWLLARCPFHSDHDPSMWIDTQQGICGCFAGCTAKPLDVVNLVSRLYDLSNHDAIRYLARQL